jgi:site-specific DNA-methyltransferase (adenine-specific)
MPVVECQCGTPFENMVRGQIKLHCSDKCRQRAKRSRDKHVTSDVTTLLDQIIAGDCRELITSIPDASIDLIFTDPPYPKEYLPLYGWLSKEAARVLKPGGFLLTYAGGLYKHDVMMQLGQHMTYFWDYLAIDSGPGTTVWPRKTIAHHKSILAYGEGKPRCKTQGAWLGSGKDKKYHAWGQDVSTARYYIDCFSYPGQVVLEPFVGGGTTCIASKLIGRHFIGFEVDTKQAEIARNRLANMQMPLLDLSAMQLPLDGEAI